MGHLGNLKQEYRDLIGRLEAGPVALVEPDEPRAQEGLREILEIMYTPEEAALAAKLPVMPSTIETISQRLRIPAAELLPRLDAMADKGVVMDFVHPRTGVTRYLLSPPVVGFFEYSMMRIDDSIPKKRMAEALEAYTHGDPAFAIEAFGHETKVGRTMVHETTLPPDAPEVLDWERATFLIEQAHTVAVSNCYCRHKAEHIGKQCDAPMEACLSLNGPAAWLDRRGFARIIERSEALDILERSRNHGLVQLADNVQDKPVYICNCCGCCCGQLQPLNEFDLPSVVPSRFQATVTGENCNGCSRCSRACPIGAITMVPERVPAERKNALRAVVDEQRCIGCGVCIASCRKESMHMAPRAEAPRVPLNGVERSVRQMIERGRLPHLVADQGASRGSHFLNQVLQTLCKLPGAERAMASEQLKSRFVAYMLGKAGARR